jgi:hypothetical protein
MRTLLAVLLLTTLSAAARADEPLPTQTPAPADCCAEPVAEAPPLPPPPPAPAIDPERPLTCRVQTVRAGWMSIRCDSPPVRGARYAIRSQRLVKISDPITGEPSLVPCNKRTGVFQVERASGFAGAGPVLRGSVVEVGDLADPTSERAEDNLAAPRLWPGLTRIGLRLAPFIPVGELGIGLLWSAELEHRFRFPLVLGVRSSPIAMTFLRGARGANAQVLAKIGFSHDYFEIAIEPGMQLEVTEQPRFVAGFSIRLGALDGLSLRFSNSYVITGQRGEERFEFANAYAEVQAPVHRRGFLIFGGGGQLENSFWFRGYFGTRLFLRGSGGPGTVLFSAALGAAGTELSRKATAYDGSLYDDNVHAIGPMIDAAVEYRF